jgi:predicted alpha/beta-hydrolase family hydrolase
MQHDVRKLVIRIDDDRSVSGIATLPAQPRAAYVFAHGAGAGMEHSFMTTVAGGLAERGIGTLRYQFPYMETGSKRTDAPAVAHAAVRAAVEQARTLFDGVELFAGGKSFGARMTSQAQSSQPMPGIRGLVFLGFPLHPAGKPSTLRADHLDGVSVPMLFIQGTRDELADWPLLEQVTTRLSARATLVDIPDADHSFHVLKRSGRTDAEAMTQLLDAVSGWIETCSGQAGAT